jgi:hypothetical protein
MLDPLMPKKEGNTRGTKQENGTAGPNHGKAGPLGTSGDADAHDDVDESVNPIIRAVDQRQSSVL